MTDQELQELRKLSKTLDGLLSHPQPGFITWNLALAAILAKFEEFQYGNTRQDLADEAVDEVINERRRRS